MMPSNIIKSAPSPLNTRPVQSLLEDTGAVAVIDFSSGFFAVACFARAIEQQIALADVPGQRRRVLELRLRLAETSQLHQQITAHARQQMVGLECRLRPQLIH